MPLFRYPLVFNILLLEITNNLTYLRYINGRTEYFTKYFPTDTKLMSSKRDLLRNKANKMPMTPNNYTSFNQNKIPYNYFNTDVSKDFLPTWYFSYLPPTYNNCYSNLLEFPRKYEVWFMFTEHYFIIYLCFFFNNTTLLPA